MFSIPRFQTAPFALSICILLSTGVLLALGGGRPAQAQQADAAETDTTIQVETKTRKSPTQAQLYSLGGTLVPVLLGAGMDRERDDIRLPLLATGIFVGPSVGHFYAENTGQALAGIGIRLGGGVLSIVGFGVALNASLEGNGGGGGAALFYAGALTGLVSAGYDIFTAGNAARDYNEAHGLSVQAAPTVGPRGEQVGLALQVSF
jgi:hypothetical protein